MPIALEFNPIPKPPISQEELDQDPLQGAMDTYLHYQYGRNTMEDNYNLLEPLPESDDSNDETEKPALTICVPVAINREDEATITRALDVISAAQQKFGRNVDVILWANAKYKDSGEDEDAVSMEAVQRYDTLRTMLSQRQDSGLHIRTALQIRPEMEGTISKVRSNYMEAVAIDVQRRGLGYDHPVMWIDADAIDMSDNALPQVVHSVQNFEALFVHPMTHYGIDWAEGQPLSQTDAATRAVAIDEIKRRQAARNHVTQADGELEIYKGDVYPEENGLTFAIGTYLSVGGVYGDVRSNESHHLVSLGIELNNGARTLYAKEHGIALSEVPLEIGILPTVYAKKLTRLPKGVLFLPASYTTMSARKQNAQVRRDGPAGLRDMWTRNYDGQHVNQRGVADAKSDAEIARELPDHIQSESESLEHPLTDRQKARLGKLVTRYFDESNESK